MSPRLTDHEIRDITATLEAGKPLDEKYRYLIFEEARQIELMWNGKSMKREIVALPFQPIEHIDEPRDEEGMKVQGSLFDTSGTRKTDWSNKLIWGDNKFVLSSLQSGQIRREIEAQGGLKLIYIDPPFDVGADFKTMIEIGDTSIEKIPTRLEEIAFFDTWGKGQDSFLAMIWDRLKLMKDLLASDGSIYVHCDWRVNSAMRLIMDEVFGKENFVSEIIWKRKTGTAGPNNGYGVQTDTILYYTKSSQKTFNPQYRKDGVTQEEIEEKFNFTDENGKRYWSGDLGSPSDRPNLKYEYKGYKPPKNGWAVSLEVMEAWDKSGKLIFPKEKTGRIRRKMYLDDWQGFPIQNLWDDIGPVQSQAKEKTGYPTQKPEKLLERIINASTNEGDLVADFFIGSGTTAAVAERLNRKWIASDLGRFAINTSRKRLINVQRNLKEIGSEFRSFEILSVGNYSYTDGANQSEFNDVIIRAYDAEKIENSPFAGKKLNRYIAIGPFDLPCSRDFVDEMVDLCVKQGITSLDILAFEFGMGVAPEAQDEAFSKGVKLNLKYIPREVFDKRAIEQKAVKFADVGFLDVQIKVKGREVTVELKDFSIHYSQNVLELSGEGLQKNKSAVVLDDGKIKLIAKDGDGIVKISDLTTKWIDWIDYWSIDFHFEDRPEIRNITNEDGSVTSTDTGRFIFDNQWQSFKTNQNDIELTSSPFEYPTNGNFKIAVKVIDVFGNDTTKIFEVKVGK